VAAPFVTPKSSAYRIGTRLQCQEAAGRRAYPCAHCITSAAIAAVLEAELGASFPEITMTSPGAPGVVRRWTTAKAFTDEVSAARIWGGIHYRTSAVVGQRMGRQIGEYAVHHHLKPIR
jgi:hypothetical protein